MIAVGIDLTGSEKKPSGWACLRDREAELRLLRTDAELVEATLGAGPAVVSLDSPLGLPRERGSIIRDAEREMMALRIGVYPCLLPSMVRLTERGMALARAFAAAGLPVIEGFPGSAQDALGIPRKKTDLGALRQGLIDYGLTVPERRIQHDELDALTAALVGQFWLRGEFHAFGNAEEGPIITPSRWRGTVQLAPYTRVGENYLAFRWGLRVGATGPVLTPPRVKTNKALFAALDALAAGAGFTAG
ncbi:MAG: DUF429 domain-containing protein [Acidobacteriota bacterium]